jgi:ABC-type transport system involved in multi-copper enzyme maturation permease subunit
MVLLQAWFIFGSGSVKSVMKSGQMHFMAIVFSFNLFGSVAALALNYDSISMERENKIMDLILTANVSKKEVILSKVFNSFIISGVFALLYVLIILLIYLIASKDLHISLLALRYVFPITVFMFIYNLLGLLLSIILRSSKASLVISVILGGLFVPRLFLAVVEGMAKTIGFSQEIIENISMISPALIMNALSGYAQKKQIILGLLLFIIYSVTTIILCMEVFSKQDELNYGE